MAGGGVSGTGVMARASRPQRPSHVYQPMYGNYTSPMNQAVYGASRGLGATPQYTQFQAQMPTFTRPQMIPPTSGGFGRFPMQALSPQPAYRIPYKPSLSQQLPAALPQGQIGDLSTGISSGTLNYDQYQMMMANPRLYTPFVQDVQAGRTPSTLTYRQQPIQYMTDGQRKAYDTRQAQELGKLLGPAPADPSVSSDGGG